MRSHLQAACVLDPTLCQYALPESALFSGLDLPCVDFNEAEMIDPQVICAWRRMPMPRPLTSEQYQWPEINSVPVRHARAMEGHLSAVAVGSARTELSGDLLRVRGATLLYVASAVS